MALRMPGLLALVSLALVRGPADDLRVLRHVPEREASPTTVIEVAFDRPIAEDIEQAVAAERVLAIRPAVAGVTEWRDPATIRFTPAAPLAIGTRFTVTVSDAFTAADGSRLPEPYEFEFQVRGPAVLTSSVAAAGAAAGYVDTRATFTLLVDGPADFAWLARQSAVEILPPCSQRRVGLLLAGDRPLTDRDPWPYRQWLYREDGTGARALHRVVELRASQELPRDCAAQLIVPGRVDPGTDGRPLRWSFHTFPALRLTTAICGSGTGFCATGPVRLVFTTPIRGAVLARALSVTPPVPIQWADTSDERTDWWIPADLKPRSAYAILLDSSLRDVFGQPLMSPPGALVRTTGYAPYVEYPTGRVMVEREAFRTITVSYLNLDTLISVVTPVPDSLLPSVLRRPWGFEELLAALPPRRTDTIVVGHVPDRSGLAGVRIPVFNAQHPGSPALIAVRVGSPALTRREGSGVALVQVTNLATHVRIGRSEGAVWVVGASDGRPRLDADVQFLDAHGHVRGRARTNAQGLARFALAAVPDSADDEGTGRDFDGYVSVVLGNDRAIVPVSAYDWELNPWRFNVRGAWNDVERAPVAAAVFTERGIYRPGETVHAKAILRRGLLGALVSPAGDSIRLSFLDREGGGLRDTVLRLSAFGTGQDTLVLVTGLPLGTYRVQAEAVIEGTWAAVGQATYRVAEYRPPEFLAGVQADSALRVAGGTLTGAIEGRYLFGAPMAGAAVAWAASRRTVGSWELDIPNTEGFTLADARWWWEERSSYPATFAQRADTLDEQGGRSVTLALPDAPDGQPYRVALAATITDVNRQTASASTSALVHPADFYVGVRPAGAAYFWQAGSRQAADIIVVRPDGSRVPDVRVNGVLIRREWHRVRRERDGFSELVGEWVADTVERCTVTTTSGDPARCTFTPPQGGQYTARFTASDAAGRRVAAGFSRWVTGPDWVPWFDETQLKMDVVPDRERYAVGDTATVMLASPFTDAEAWVTVEREGILEERRLRITSGTTTLRVPITEAHVPNAYVSVIVSRGRTSPPGQRDDPGRPVMRVGYAELRVVPDVKRLTVDLQPLAVEYRPGDTARVRIAVRDAGGHGRRSEVTLWAVDEGILALTDYRTPDPIDLLYQPRGVGMRLGSNLIAVAPQVAADQGAVGLEKGREPGGGGGSEAEGILRSRFASTAFFLASVETDEAGNAVAAARLPDNLTTFRVMGVAVTRGDRYGSGTSSLLVTRPLLARPALPRFVRPGDRPEAGVVVNQRLGGATDVTVEVQAKGITVTGDRKTTTRIAGARGREVRFPLTATEADTAVLQFTVRGGGEADAVEARLPVVPAFYPRSITVAGLLRDTASATITVPGGTDPDRSRLEVRLGTSPLAPVRAMTRWFRVYPYYCSEQVTSTALPLLALVRAARALSDSSLAPRTAARDIAEAVRTILRRQRGDGGIGYWGSTDWTTPWLSSYAGRVLLEARDLNVAVPDSALAALADYLTRSLRRPLVTAAWLGPFYRREALTLGDQLAAVDFLRTWGAPDVAAENRLLSQAARLSYVDRARLAAVFAGGGRLDDARRLLEPLWSQVRIAGRRAVLPDSADDGFYFSSSLRAPATLLAATVAVDSLHPLVGPLVETLVTAGRGAQPWNTQDLGAAVPALARLARSQARAETRGLRLRLGSRTITLPADSTIPLTRLAAGGAAAEPLSFTLSADRDGPAVFYNLTVQAVPREQPVRPDDGGIRVEHWYERLTDGRPVTTVAAGDLVRVRLRVTVPGERLFVVLDDPLPGGLEAVDASLRTQADVPGANAVTPDADEGIWYGRWWSPFGHREIRDDRVVFAANRLRSGSYDVTYVARATTPGVFVRPPAHAEEMYNPAVYGRSEGGTFTVTATGR